MLGTKDNDGEELTVGLTLSNNDEFSVEFTATIYVLLLANNNGND